MSQELTEVQKAAWSYDAAKLVDFWEAGELPDDVFTREVACRAVLLPTLLEIDERGLRGSLSAALLNGLLAVAVGSQRWLMEYSAIPTLLEWSADPLFGADLIGDARTPDVVGVLLEAGCSATADALVRSVMGGTAATVQALVQAGASPTTVVMPTGMTALHAATRPQVLAEILKSGADPDARDARGATALHRAASIANTANIELLLDAGADINARDGAGRTPLHEAIAAGKAARAGVAVLVERGAELNTRDDKGDTPLHRALTRRDDKVVEHLLAAGADPAQPVKGKRKVKGTVVEDGATTQDLALAAKLPLTPSSHTFAKERSIAERFRPKEPPLSQEEAGRAGRIQELLVATFGTLPRFLGRRGKTNAESLRAFTGVLFEGGRTVRRKLPQPISDGLFDLYTAAFEIDVHWSHPDDASIQSIFRLQPCQQMFGGPTWSQRQTWKAFAAKQLRIDPKTTPGLKKKYLWGSEEFGFTLLEFYKDKPEQVFFYPSYDLDLGVVPMRLDVAAYVRALCAFRGLSGWQAHFYDGGSVPFDLEEKLGRVVGGEGVAEAMAVVQEAKS